MVKGLIVSHTRSGTHYLCKLLNDNVIPAGEDYTDWHYSHTRVPLHPYVHLYRSVLPTMLSIWQIREHLGVAKDVTFSQLIGTPYEDLPKSTSAQATLNGEFDGKVCAPTPFTGTFPERWLKLNRMFRDNAKMTVNYDIAVSRPYATLRNICEMFGLFYRSTLHVPQHRVGWQPVERETPVMQLWDYKILETYECQYYM